MFFSSLAVFAEAIAEPPRDLGKDINISLSRSTSLFTPEHRKWRAMSAAPVNDPLAGRHQDVGQTGNDDGHRPSGKIRPIADRQTGRGEKGRSSRDPGARPPGCCRKDNSSDLRHSRGSGIRSNVLSNILSFNNTCSRITARMARLPAPGIGAHLL